MADPGVERAIGALEGRVAGLEGWAKGLDHKLDEAIDAIHDLRTELALTRHAGESVAGKVGQAEKVLADYKQMRAVGKLAASFLMSVGAVVGAVLATAGGKWVSKLFGWD